MYTNRKKIRTPVPLFPFFFFVLFKNDTEEGPVTALLFNPVGG